MPDSIVNLELPSSPNLFPIHGKKCVKLKCLPLTPFGIPVDPEVKLRVAGESGPSTTPAGVWAYC